jgi:hypothetical protein
LIIVVNFKKYLLLKYEQYLFEILEDLEKDLGNNFNRLEQIVVGPFSNDVDMGAFYHYRNIINKGCIFINSNVFGLNVDKKVITKHSFEYTIAHEIGHHIYKTNDLEKEVSEFYKNSDGYIKNNFKNISEFFAECFSKFYNGDFDSYGGVTVVAKSKIYYFIEDIYDSLKGEKNGK